MCTGSDNTADLVAEYAAPLPVTVIAELLGVANDDRRKFHRWSNAIVAADTSVWHKVRAIPAGLAFILFLRRLIRQPRSGSRDDLLGRLIEVQEEGDRLSADELLAMCFLLLVAGHETTVNLIGNGVLALLENPEQMQHLRDEPALIPSAVEEVLRYSSPLQLATERCATANVKVGEVTIPRGALVYVVLASANRDERHSPAPPSSSRTDSRTGIWPSDTASTIASAHPSRGWKVRSRYDCCSNGSARFTFPVVPLNYSGGGGSC